MKEKINDLYRVVFAVSLVDLSSFVGLALFSREWNPMVWTDGPRGVFCFLAALTVMVVLGAIRVIWED